ncbi:MAG: hypothetical protein Kow0063_11300 [Anaerolineae bacterium]
MPTIADTGYLFALADTKDIHHQSALEVARAVSDTIFVYFDPGTVPLSRYCLEKGPLSAVQPLYDSRSSTQGLTGSEATARPD